MVALDILARLSAAATILCTSSISLRGLAVALPVNISNIAQGDVPLLTGVENVMGSGTYPRANYLQDGSIIGSYTAFPGDNSTITIVQSTDGGVSWSEIGTVASGPVATTDIDNPYPLQLPSGRILVAFRNHSRLNGVYTYFRITICYSDDNGVTWSYLSTPASDPGPTTGDWEPFLRMNGSVLQLYYSRENSAVDQDSLMRTSTDDGVTWSSATTISGGDLNSTRDGMLGVTQVGDDSLIAVFESETNGGTFSVYSVTSADNGTTWGDRSLVYASPSGHNARAPQVTNVGGVLVVSFMTDEDDDDESCAIKILTSSDGGSSWGDKTTVFPENSTWAGLLALDSGTSLLTLADYSGSKVHEVLLW